MNSGRKGLEGGGGSAMFQDSGTEPFTVSRQDQCFDL